MSMTEAPKQVYNIEPPQSDVLPERSIRSVYEAAGDLEVLLSRPAQSHPNDLLSFESIKEFNELLRYARFFAPNSVALKEDIDIITEPITVMEAHRALKTTIVPTLHNILPETDGETVRV